MKKEKRQTKMITCSSKNIQDIVITKECKFSFFKKMEVTELDLELKKKKTDRKVIRYALSDQRANCIKSLSKDVAFKNSYNYG